MEEYEYDPLEIIRQQGETGNVLLRASEQALKAAELEKDCVNENKKAIFEAVKEHARAYIPLEEEQRFLANVQRTSCAPPSSKQMVPVLLETYREVLPKIQHKTVIEIKGKKWFWAAVVMFALCVTHICHTVWQKNTFDGTAESWANRMYVAAKEIGEKNPGDGYDEVMTAFASGSAENAKELVIRKENKLSELQDHRGKYERKISEYLSGAYPSGIRIIELEETTQQQNDKDFDFFGREYYHAVNYNFVYAQAITLDEQSELRIVMKRRAGLPSSKHLWDIFITTDSRINSVADYRQKASKVKWLYSERAAIKIP